MLPNYSKVHLISGLPRSGSTLLAGLLRQNPQFHAGMTSPVVNLMNRMLESTVKKQKVRYSLALSKKGSFC